MKASPKKYRLQQTISGILSLLLGGALGLVAGLVFVRKAAPTLWAVGAGLAVGALSAYIAYRFLMRKYTRRHKIAQGPFPPAWRDILEKRVRYYRRLSPEEKARFEKETLIFLSEHDIIGVKTEVDDLTRLLVAASAVIPVFGFPDWEYDHLGEILIYPDSFNLDFERQSRSQNHILGLVGNERMLNVMILSKPDLIDGFRYGSDKQNVGVHEFAHLLDRADGQIDGAPSIFMENQYLAPWLELMKKEIFAILEGRSDINPYAATNPQEFFAVVTEYFFERPHSLKEEHPELYDLLQKVFHQDPYSLYSSVAEDMLSPRKRMLQPIMPCPCESGLIYKNCCSPENNKI